MITADEALSFQSDAEAELGNKLNGYLLEAKAVSQGLKISVHDLDTEKCVYRTLTKHQIDKARLNIVVLTATLCLEDLQGGLGH